MVNEGFNLVISLDQTRMFSNDVKQKNVTAV